MTADPAPSEIPAPHAAPASRSRNRRTWTNFKRALKHPLFLAIITFLFTGVLAARYQDKLADNAKQREISLSKRQKTSDAVKTISDLLFERVFRGNMVVSSINRGAQSTELNDRKKAYDEIFVKYNSTIQSNLFRLREMFNTTQYTDFELAMESGLRDLLKTQDDCITLAYDSASSNDEIRRKGATNILNQCKPSAVKTRVQQLAPESMPMGDIYQVLLHCEYVFSNALFQVVEGDDVPSYKTSHVPRIVDEACALPIKPTPTAQSK